MAFDGENIQSQLHSGTFPRRQFLEAAVALGISSAFSTRALAETPRRGGDLIIASYGGFSGDTLDPAVVISSYMHLLGCLYADSFTVMSEDGNVRPALATEWEAKPGSKEWVFKVRKGVTFHNGKTLSADDVVYSINHHRGKDSQSGAKALLSSILDIKATASHEVSILLSHGNVDLPALLADFQLLIVPENSKFNEGIGTGAFVLEKFEPGIRALARRNPNDWRNDRGYVNSVELVSINDSTARINALLSGAVHMVSNIPPSIISFLENNPRIKIFNTPGGGYRILAMHVDVPPFDSNDLRLAMKYAIDRELILRNVYQGYGIIGNDHPIAPFDPYCAADIPQRRYDIDRAKYHYKKSGHSGPIELCVSPVALESVDIAQIFKETAAKAGINIQINRISNAVYFDTVKGGTKPFFASYWGAKAIPDLVFSFNFSSDSPANDTHWRRPKFDELQAAARAEPDKAKRKQMYHDMQYMLHQEGGAIIPIFPNRLIGAMEKIRGFVPSPAEEWSVHRAPEKVWFAS